MGRVQFVGRAVGIGTGKSASGTAVQFKAAWFHLVNVFRAAGATNVRFVWNPDIDPYTGITDMAACWLGADYVDVLGIDGYNRAGLPGQPWASSPA